MQDTQLNVWNVTEQLLKSKVVNIFGEVNTRMAEEVVSLLTVLNNDDPNEVIKIIVCTPGGSVLDGFAIHDKIKEISNPVVCFCTGHSCSMGTIISSACDYVFASEDASLMIHELSSRVEGKYSDMENQLKFDKLLNERLMTVLAEKCHKPLEVIMEDSKKDHWMSAKEALEYGLIDAITPFATKSKKSLDAFLKAMKPQEKKNK